MNLTKEVSMMKPLTVTLHIGGKQVEKLTDEQCEKISQRLTETVSRYYSSHIDEYLKIKNDLEG